MQKRITHPAQRNTREAAPPAHLRLPDNNRKSDCRCVYCQLRRVRDYATAAADEPLIMWKRESSSSLGNSRVITPTTYDDAEETIRRVGGGGATPVCIYTSRISLCAECR